MGAFMPLLMKVLPTLLGVGGALGGSAIGAGQTKRNIELQQEHNKELVEMQYNKDLEMWERANLYNEPSQQMKRLREAGLNPALMYGSGKAANVAAQTMPKYQAIKTDFSKRRNPLEALNTLGLYQNMQLKSAQIDNVKEQTNNVRIKNGIERLNEAILAARSKVLLGDTRSFFTKDDEGNPIANIRKGPYLNWLLNYQLDALRLQNELKGESIKLSKQKQTESYYNWSLKKFDYNMWKELGTAGKLGQFSVPFIRLLLGR